MVQPAKFQALQQEMEWHLFERREELEGLLLALLSRQHLLLIGPKGAAKSLMIRLLASSIEGAKYFERLLTRFTLPDELFGPVSISALKKDRFSRLTRGYLPEAHFAFLDEIHDAREAVEGVEVDRPLLESIAKIRRRLGAEGLSLSDRRYKESLSIVRSNAWLNGRTYAIEDDLAVLANILWDDPASEPL